MSPLKYLPPPSVYLNWGKARFSPNIFHVQSKEACPSHGWLFSQQIHPLASHSPTTRQTQGASLWHCLGGSSVTTRPTRSQPPWVGLGGWFCSPPARVAGWWELFKWMFMEQNAAFFHAWAQGFLLFDMFVNKPLFPARLFPVRPY